MPYHYMPMITRRVDLPPGTVQETTDNNDCLDNEVHGVVYEDEFVFVDERVPYPYDSEHLITNPRSERDASGISMDKYRGCLRYGDDRFDNGNDIGSTVNQGSTCALPDGWRLLL